MYTCRHFKLSELVPPSVLNDLGERAWMMLDDRLLKFIDDLRDDLGKKIYVNRGDATNRGFRLKGKVAKAANYSQHYYGRAIDFTVEGMSAQEVRQYIKDNKVKYPMVRRMEKDVDWVHVDCANWGDDGEITEFSA